MSFIPHSEWQFSGLVASINNNALLPAAQQTFTPAVMLQMLNEACQSRVVPLIVGFAANYFLRTVNVAIISNSSRALTVGTTGTSGSNVGYPLPADAIGKKLSDVSVVNSNGTAITLPMVTRWQAGSMGSYAQGCFVDGDVLYLYPAYKFSSYSTIQIQYFASPMALCDDTGLLAASVASSAAVVSVNATTGAVQLSGGAVPASFTVGAAVNFIGGTPQFTTNAVTTLTTVSGNTVFVPPAVLTDAFGRPTVNVGDWLANAGYSPFLQLPVEARNLVTQAAIVKLLSALKDLDGKNDAEKDYQTMAADSAKIFTPRIDDSPKVITSRGQGIGAYGAGRAWWARR